MLKGKRLLIHFFITDNFRKLFIFAARFSFRYAAKALISARCPSLSASAQIIP
jgi:hypothetical protein